MGPGYVYWDLGMGPENGTWVCVPEPRHMQDLVSVLELKPGHTWGDCQQLRC